jgi:hypothetical protein
MLHSSPEFVCAFWRFQQLIDPMQNTSVEARRFSEPVNKPETVDENPGISNFEPSEKLCFGGRPHLIHPIDQSNQEKGHDTVRFI